MFPHYPFPWRMGIALIWDALHRSPRSFREDAITCTQLLAPQLKILGDQAISKSGPCLLVTNHHSHHGFSAWWTVLGISAAVPKEIYWLMTVAWTFLGPLEPFTRWLFPRLAQVYGFTTSPPMPPDPYDGFYATLARHQRR